MNHQSFSSRETKKLGEGAAKRFLRKGLRRHGATVLALIGELGSGKTTFVQGFLRGLGVKRGGTSPTFILMRRHAMTSSAKAAAGKRHKKFKNVYHVDAYRIKKPSELAALKFEDVLCSRKNLVLIEWADRVKSILPKNISWIRFHHGQGENKRTIVIKSALVRRAGNKKPHE